MKWNLQFSLLQGKKQGENDLLKHDKLSDLVPKPNFLPAIMSQNCQKGRLRNILGFGRSHEGYGLPQNRFWSHPQPSWRKNLDYG